MPAPPGQLGRHLDSYVRDHAVPWTDLNAASEALAALWRPLLVSEQESGDATWDPEAWAWSAAM